MQANNLPLFQHPTKLMVIDDNPSFLTNIIPQIKTQGQIFSTTHTEELLTQLETQPNLHQAIIKKCVVDLTNKLEDYDDQINKHPLELTLSPILNLFSQNNYKKQISIIIADYHMPEMTGVELFQKIKHCSCKKILITGIGDDKIAIDAFNQGIIDKFINKHSFDFFEQLNKAIIELQISYFNDLSKSIKSLINSFVGNFYSSSNLTQWIYQNIIKSNYIEYYFLDIYGSHFIVDNNNIGKLVVIRTRDEINKLYRIAKDNDAKQNIISHFEKIDAFPFLLTEADYNLSVNQWSAKMLPISNVFADKFYISEMQNMAVDAFKISHSICNYDKNITQSI